MSDCSYSYDNVYEEVEEEDEEDEVDEQSEASYVSDNNHGEEPEDRHAPLLFLDGEANLVDVVKKEYEEEPQLDYRKIYEWFTRNQAHQREHIKEMLIAIAVSLFIFVVISFVFITLHLIERNRTLGMTFESRIHPLPIHLPFGILELRTFMLPLPTDNGDFTPFIASSQQPGINHIVTNATHPAFNAYFVEHPVIENVVMISDDFFCSATTCFFLTDVNNDEFFKTTVVNRNITYQLVEVPLPTGFRFMKADYCAFLHNPTCTILLEGLKGELRFGEIKKKGSLPSVEISNEPIEGAGSVKAFHFSSKLSRIISWTDGKLAVFHQQHPNSVTYIEDVEEKEIVELLAVSDVIQIVLVMKEVEGRTR